MSCNGCRVLRKGCSESCLLRPCLQWMETPEAQARATEFAAKFFGRAGLMSFISSVPESHLPAMFQSLLFEACGRTINAVSGAAGLLWTGNWHLCQAAVETVLRGGTIGSLPELASAGAGAGAELYDGDFGKGHGEIFATQRMVYPAVDESSPPQCDLDLCLTPLSTVASAMENLRPVSPPLNSDESSTTTADSGQDRLPRLLNLFL